MTTDTPVNEAAGGEQPLDDVDAAISTLEVALNAFETIERINRAEGNVDQAVP